LIKPRAPAVSTAGTRPGVTIAGGRNRPALATAAGGSMDRAGSACRALTGLVGGRV
jgi:hypothetical protein